MSAKQRLGSVLFLTILVAGSAYAVPNGIILSGTFTDGGTISGTLTYDPATNTYANVNVVTTAGTTINTGATFHFIDAAANPSTSGFVLLGASNAADLTGTRAVGVSFAPALTGATGKGAISLVEAPCANAVCASPGAPLRSGSGTFVNVNAIPTFSTWASVLTVLSLLAAGLFVTRKG